MDNKVSPKVNKLKTVRWRIRMMKTNKKRKGLNLETRKEMLWMSKLMNKHSSNKKKNKRKLREPAVLILKHSVGPIWTQTILSKAIKTRRKTSKKWTAKEQQRCREEMKDKKEQEIPFIHYQPNFLNKSKIYNEWVQNKMLISWKI